MACYKRVGNKIGTEGMAAIIRKTRPFGRALTIGALLAMAGLVGGCSSTSMTRSSYCPRSSPSQIRRRFAIAAWAVGLVPVT